MAFLERADAKTQKLIADDLASFALVEADLDVRNISPIEMERIGIDPDIIGYKIPYYDINGKPLKHYRIRRLPNSNDPNDDGVFIRSSVDIARIYFPPDFSDTTGATVTVYERHGKNKVSIEHTPIIIVDDERMAAYITKTFGYLSVAIQGPSGWQTSSGIADGLMDLCELALEMNYTLVIWIGDGTDKNMQKEVANLAMEIKFQGIKFKNIKQYTEDVFTVRDLVDVLEETTSFPKHPNIRQYIQEKIGNDGSRLTRKDCAEIGTAVLADMEATGFRIRSTTTDGLFYFDRRSKRLMEATLAGTRDIMENSDFMSYIYTKYGLSPMDTGILKWFSTQFVAEEPIQRTTSHRILMCDTRKEPVFALQVSESEFVHIGTNGTARVRENGDFGILFEMNKVIPMNVNKLKKELVKQRRQEKLPMWWLDVVKEVRLDKDMYFRKFLSLLYYISPWLKGWQGIQLPVEVITGEAGTGKSSLFALRLLITTGDPKLGGLPSDIKGWHTKVVSTSGICVFDNVHMMNKTHIQSLSDEMCRLVTEPTPTISMRQLYKTAEMADFPLQCTFGLTSIENVFTKPDFIQRSVIIHLDRAYSDSEEILFGGWLEDKLNSHGGREAWLAHHLIALERFFAIASSEWDSNYKSKTRLINFEQALITMGKVFDIDVSWLPNLIVNNFKETAVTLDWTLEGLKKFSEYWAQGKTDEFTAADIVNWAVCQDDFESSSTLTNARRLGRYISNNKTVIKQTLGIMILGTQKRGAIYAITRNNGLEGTNTKKAIGSYSLRTRPRRNNGNSSDDGPRSSVIVSSSNKDSTGVDT